MAEMQTQQSLHEIARFYRRLQGSAVAIAVLALVWLLAPILTPFVFAGMLGWLGDPMVDRLEATGRSRNTAVILVFSLMLLLLVLALLILVPLIERQLLTLIESMPRYRDWFIGTALPWLEHRTGLQLLAWFDTGRIIDTVRAH